MSPEQTSGTDDDALDVPSHFVTCLSWHLRPLTSACTLSLQLTSLSQRNLRAREPLAHLPQPLRRLAIRRRRRRARRLHEIVVHTIGPLAELPVGIVGARGEVDLRVGAARDG